MRPLKTIVIHHAATKVTPAGKPQIDAKLVRKWHVEERGWSDIGYHYFIKQDGSVEVGRPLHRPGAHVRGYNATTIGICIAGGLSVDDQPENNYTQEQLESLRILVDDLRTCFPTIDKVCGHKELDPHKPFCPMIEVSDL